MRQSKDPNLRPCRFWFAKSVGVILLIINPVMELSSGSLALLKLSLTVRQFLGTVATHKKQKMGLGILQLLNWNRPWLRIHLDSWIKRRTKAIVQHFLEYVEHVFRKCRRIGFSDSGWSSSGHTSVEVLWCFAGFLLFLKRSSGGRPHEY